MKIALVYNERLPAVRYGGVERVVMNLAKSYRELGHEVFLLAGQGSELADYDHAIYPADKANKDISQFLPADVDFVHLSQPEPVKPSKPHLFTIHGNASPGEKFFPNTSFVSASHARNHRAKYYVLQAVDVARYPYVAQKEDYYVFMAKAKWRVKNLKTALAFANDLGVRLKVIGGDGRNTKNVEYLGFLGDHEGRLEILSKARALIYPTNWDEPCAMAPLEAFACGTPVIGSTNGSMLEVVEPRVGLITSKYPDFLGFHAALSGIRPDDCRTVAEEKFSARRQAQDYLKLMARVLEMGSLDQSPAQFDHPDTVSYLYKPTAYNRLVYRIRGKI